MSEKRNTDWFATWFDSPYYHILYKHRNHEEAELFIDHLVNFLKLQPGSRILDLACGKGRHSLFLNKKGFDVTGLDLSLASIQYASGFENEKLHFYVHDMRKLFRTNYFDLILNLFTSFGYFEHERDEMATIEAIAKELKPGGTFILDFFNAEKVIKTMCASEEKLVDGICFNISRKHENNYIIKQISFSDHGKDFHFEEKVRALRLSDFERYFSSCGLKIVHLWGNYELASYEAGRSERLIIMAKKP